MAADAFSNHRKVPENNSPIAAETSATRRLLEINDAAGNALLNATLHKVCQNSSIWMTAAGNSGLLRVQSAKLLGHKLRALREMNE